MDKKFNVVYTGLQEGITAEDFIAKFCSKFGISEQKARQIINSTADVVVKTDLEEKKAAQYRTAFESCGMIIRVDEIAVEPEAAGGLSLEPMTNDASDAAETNSKGKALCPKCGSDQIEGDECQACGIYISKYLLSQQNTTIVHEPEVEKTENKTQTNSTSDSSDDNNPYATPEASLERNIISKDGQGSLEGGLNGDYDFSIGDIFSEAWQRTKGAKGTFLLAWGIYMLVAMAISFVFYFTTSGAQSATQSSLQSLVNIPLLYPIMAGITLMGIHRSVDADINASSVLGYYKQVIPITALILLMSLLIMLGTLLLIIPGIYLGIAYMMALALMMDRNMGIWEALETSRKAVSKHWFKIFFIYLLLFLLMIAAMIPVFIGLIWVLPMLAIVQGVMYKYIFGVESIE